MKIRNKMIQSVGAEKVIQNSDFRMLTDLQVSAFNAKYDAQTVTDSRDGLMTMALFSKLAGIAEGANNYVHPSSHPATMIDQDTTHRFTTDAEKTFWNEKASTDVATTVANGLMSSVDKTKLDNVAENANNYVHPANHPATMITQDTTHRFVTDEEKATWTAKQDALGYTAENTAMKGVADGYAGLDSHGKVPLTQLPDAAQSITVIAEDIAARDAIDTTTMRSGDRVIVLNSGGATQSREGYILERNGGGEGIDIWHKDSDTDWENINLDWANLINGPQSSVANIDAMVARAGELTANTGKLAGIEANAQVNQLAFSTLSNGTVDVTAETQTDKVSVLGGKNITVSADNLTKELTVAVSGVVDEAAHAVDADKALKLTTAREIRLTGDVTGAINFDGSGNVEIATTVVELNTHTHEISEVENLQAALDTKATKAVATTEANGLMSSADKAKLDLAKNRHVKSIVIVPSNLAEIIPTGIMTNGSGQNYTDIADIVSLSVNGLIQSKGADKDYTVSEAVGNQLEISWKNRHFSLDSDDEIVITYNQLG